MKNLFFCGITMPKVVLSTSLLVTNILCYAQLEKTYATSQTNQVYGVCVLCSVQNPQKAVGSNETDYATINLPVGLDASIEQEFTFPLAPAYRKISIGIGTANTPTKQQLQREIYVETFNNNVSNGDRRRVVDNMYKATTNNKRGTIEFVAEKQFDKVIVSINSGSVGINLAEELRIYYVHHLPTQFTACGNPPVDPYVYYPMDGDLNDKIRGKYLSSSGHLFSDGKCGESIEDVLGGTGLATVAVDKATLLSTGATISFWGKIKTVNPGLVSYIRVFDIQNMEFMIATDNTYLFQNFTPEAPENINFGLNPDEFAHYLLTFSPNGDNSTLTLTLYINGERQGEIQNWDTPKDDNFIQFHLGKSSIDELIIYNRELTDEEIQSFANLYNRPSNLIASKAQRAPASEIFTLSPNPTTGQITLNGDIQFADAEIFVTNTFGKKVYSSKFQSKTFELPATLPAGIYILNLKTKEGKIYSQKVMLRR
ncbi:LamG-like jellyroll fold domain-containing protein [Chryseobacterium sp. PMSZPI]|uniref:LamG-like jellyroll fold domain-containing protein n=1 Tax=Chryseobacterium sp. PMSZPI TaxID=1033900 RepID=UPI000C326D70|nr:LamG-like jellyroll fold domain-containing protein [Chryseobacterium sp. PMSZPI]PKF73869.1 hypothetical protein CW752_12075 [Chryseobacterium sp. PMSZPI]